MSMDGLPDNFIKPLGNATKWASVNRPAPFSVEDFNTESIEQGSQAYVHHVEKSVLESGRSELLGPDLAIADTEPQQSPAKNGLQPIPKQHKPSRPTQSGTKQKRSAPTAATSQEKANIRLEIAPEVRKDMIKIKHKVGITHGVEVSYAAYFMFLHERCRAENGTAEFLADLARFVEQRKLH